MQRMSQKTKNPSDPPTCIEKLNINTEISDHQYHLLAEKAISLEKAVITDVDIHKLTNTVRCAIACSGNSCEVFQLHNSNFSNLLSLSGHKDQVTNVRFSPDSENVLYTSSLDCCLRVWDVRTGQSVQELRASKEKPLSCMGVSCNNRILCAGTELTEGDANLLFWDTRSSNLLGGYFESHTDDITSIAFHPNLPDSVLTGATDGLVNFFDLRETSEEDALQSTLNTESSVAQIRWQSDDVLSVTTHIQTVQLWRTDAAEPHVQWERKEMAKALGAETVDTYVIDVFNKNGDEIHVLCGSFDGKGECVKLLNAKKDKLILAAPLIGNTQVIHASAYLSEVDWLFTVGDSGHLSAWHLGKTEKQASNLPMKTKTRKKHNPY